MYALTLQLPPDLDVAQLVREAVARAAADAAAGLPQPDCQYTVPRVAEILEVDAATVRRYLRLPAGHARRLPYVDTTGTPHGWRVRDSDLKAWQERNRARLPEELTPALTRPARRQAA